MGWAGVGMEWGVLQWYGDGDCTWDEALGTEMGIWIEGYCCGVWHMVDVPVSVLCVERRLLRCAMGCSYFAICSCVIIGRVLCCVLERRRARHEQHDRPVHAVARIRAGQRGAGQRPRHPKAKRLAALTTPALRPCQCPVPPGDA
eukprot:gene18728-biopygen899